MPTRKPKTPLQVTSATARFSTTLQDLERLEQERLEYDQNRLIVQHTYNAVLAYELRSLVENLKNPHPFLLKELIKMFKHFAGLLEKPLPYQLSTAKAEALRKELARIKRGQKSRRTR